MNLSEVFIESIQDISTSTKLFSLNLKQNIFNFLPGQWIDLYLENNESAPVAGYSLVNFPVKPPQENKSIQLAIKKSDFHPVTIHLHEKAKINDRLFISQAQGEIVLKPEMTKPIILIAGGIGITPLKCMADFAFHFLPDLPCTLIHSVKVHSEFIFHDIFQNYQNSSDNFNYIQVSTEQISNELNLETIRIDQKMIKSLSFFEQSHYFLCGPKDMIINMNELLIHSGISEDNIFFELW